MFKHFLLPTDGSAASEQAIRRALALARDDQARVTALHVIQPFHLFSYHVDMIEETRASYEANVHGAARAILAAVERGAKEWGVPVETLTRVADHPYESIIQVAQERGCDLIVMATHGRRGTKAVLMGSETQKVITHSSVPVLVLH